MHINPRADFLYAIMDTNPQEASEFVSVFANSKVLIVAIITPLILFLYSKWTSNHNKGNRIRVYIGLPLVILSTVLFLYRPSVWVDGFLSVVYNAFKFEQCPDLTKYTTHPNLIFKEPHPKNIVIIIGESEAKNHSSLYNYNYPTNPRLEQLRTDSSLFVFQNVTSSASLTVNVFKYLFNTAHPQNDDKENWYEATTLFEVTRLCGYKSSWLSNQSKHGIWGDNLIGKISELCDTAVFVGNRYAGMERHWLDGELIPITKSIVSKCDKQSLTLTIIHLMGSHESFYMRYPSDFSFFKASDYQDYPEHQRETRASYDNSILYNDYVVSQIIQLYSKTEAIVFYFSDHGLDLYETDPNYFGHATPDTQSQKIGVQIPFMVYTSPL